MMLALLMTPPDSLSAVLSMFSKAAMLMKACAFQCLSAICKHSRRRQAPLPLKASMSCSQLT